jgi:DNA-binding MurR/RpiR family transcriptional regulator
MKRSGPAHVGGEADDFRPRLADRVVATMPSLTDAERKAARALLARYPTTGMETVALFAERAHVSAPTVLRFISKLGFAGYPEFRRALLEEMEAQSEYPLTRWRDTRTVALPHFGECLIDAVRTSLAMSAQTDIAKLVELLADERRQVFLLGGDFTDSAARHLEFHLRKMRKRVRLLAPGVLRRADELAEVQRRDIVVLFDIRRYQPDTVRTAEIAKEHGAAIVLFTDQWMSDVAQTADLVLRAQVDVPSPWDSLIGIIAIVEMVALMLDQRLRPLAKSRFESIEAMRGKLRQ